MDRCGFMLNGFGAVLSAMLITMFFMGAEMSRLLPRESDTWINISHAPPILLSGDFHFTVFHFCGAALIPWNMPGLKSVGLYRSAGAFHIPHAKLLWTA
ncbi:hypothetical protein KCP75_14525 [Salmonella enterica subsp. enterica]|nr:hypothetical protein KCP75_14525 [Salmonella enterica subsp. enterica]